MSNLGMDARGRASLTGERCALIAAPGSRAELAAALEDFGLAFDAFTDVDELLSVQPRELSLVVLWVQDPASNLSATVDPLTRSFPDAPIVIVCTSIERWGVRAALSAGAAGVVLSDNLASTLGPCIDAVLAGQACVPRAHARQIEPPPLSSREKQILGLVVMGYTNGQIARQLFLAESTVKSHLSSAFGKLGVRSRNEAVNLILNPERGLGMGILALGSEPLELSSTSP
jgi:DNA-binding NarL/FixJ family response regulator